VRDAFVRFARWLRREYEFPLRLPVYLLPGEIVVTMDGKRCSASFFAPWDRTVEPFARVATGDYPKIEAKVGRDDALASFLVSLAHEIIHYQQWVKTGEISERGVARKASAMVDRYARTVDRP
jgi:hypothetical protein